jgi:hypothetical protein
LIRDGDVRVAVRLVASTPFQFSQTNKFTIAPEAASNTAYILGKASFADQWHLKATTDKPSDEVKFLAILVPYRESEPEPKIELLQGDGTIGFRVAGTDVAAWWGAGSRGKISAAGVTGDGRMVVNATEPGKAEHVIAP